MMDDLGGLGKLELRGRTLMGKGLVWYKGYRAYLRFIYDGIKV